MNWKIEQIAGMNFVRVTCEGSFSVQSQSRCIDKLLASSFWRPGSNLLFDNRNFDFGEVNAQKTRDAIQNFEIRDQRLGRGKIALLMGSKVSYGLGRQFQLLSEGKLSNEVGVFDNEQEAVNWLNAPAASR